MMSVAGKSLWGAAVVCLAVMVVCLLALRVEAPRLLGVHPALKPLKFAISIGLFLATLAVLLPHLQTSGPVRLGLAVVLVATNAVELGLIALQAARGRTSHFNTATPLDKAITLTMAGAIVVMLGGVVAVAWLATFRDLVACDAAITLAWRVGLWLFVLVAVTGFTMVSHGRHTVGAPDGSAGLPIANWSRTHGDLRVPHFIALHALQVLPLFALACRWIPVSAGARLAIVAVACLGYVAGSVASMAWAVAGRPVL